MTAKDPIEEALLSCEREPIQFLGQIQPHGYLIAFDQNWQVRQISRNLLADRTRQQAGPITLHSLLGEELAGALRLIAPTLGKEALLLNAQDWATDAKVRGRIRVHRTDDYFVVELDAQDESAPVDTAFASHLDGFLIGLQAANSLSDFCQALASEFHTMLGFDRVLIYQFEANWDGVVVAEAGNRRLPALLHHHFPAADIPAQARALYTLNPIRILADVNAPPVELIEPSGDAAITPLDMSHCMLRAISPVHIEYLRNMGVGASLSLSLVVNGKLWGLVACHHQAPRHISTSLFADAERASRIASLKLESLLAAEQVDCQRRTNAAISQLSRLFAGRPEREVIADWLEQEILPLLGASGCWLALPGQHFSAGLVPDAHAIPALLRWLPKQLDGQPQFITDHLAACWPPGSTLAGTVAGLLAICPSESSGIWLLWFRREVIRTIPWAGSPQKNLVDREGHLRLEPRRSFAAWAETVHQRSLPWADMHQDAALTIGHALQAAMVEYLLQEKETQLRQMAEGSARLKSLFLNSISHELRTPLHGILGFCRSTARKLDELPRDKVISNLQNIEKSALRLNDFVGEVVNLAEFESGTYLLDHEICDLAILLGTLLREMDMLFLGRSLDVTLTVDAAQHSVTGEATLLGRLFRNLLSNAQKFSRNEGAVHVHLRPATLEESGQPRPALEVSIEDSGPGIPENQLESIFQPFHYNERITPGNGDKGLGLAVSRAIVDLHGGTLRAANLAAGACFTVTLPVDRPA